MASDSIQIVHRDGREAREPTTHYRAADAREENAICDTLTGALAYARRTIPHHPQAVWAIWPTGLGHFAVREAVRRH